MIESIDPKMSSNTDCYYRTNAPKVTINLWKCLQRMAEQSNRRRFVKQLFIENADQFQSEEQLKTIIKQSIEERLLAEDWYQIEGKVRFRLLPLMDRKQFFGQTNDYYCFECHSCDSNQSLIGCKSCFRSIHWLCLKNRSTAYNNEGMDLKAFECEYCRKQMSSAEEVPKSENRLNELFGEELKKLIEMFYTKLETHYKDFDIYSEYSIVKSPETDVLVFYFLDLATIRRKVFEFQNYSSFAEFESDLKHFCHNFSVMNEESEIATFIQMIDNELKELSRCLDCYRYSRAVGADKLEPEKWFTRVCTPPHRLVFAKYHTYPYWPSKVVEWPTDSTQCLVQFFQPKHFTRAEVLKDRIREIDHKFSSKHYTSDKMLASTALLCKYLENWKQIDHNFGFDRVLNRLNSLLSTELAKNKNQVLRKLNLNLESRVSERKEKLAKKRTFDQSLDENCESKDNESNKLSKKFGTDEQNTKFSQIFTKLLTSESLEIQTKSTIHSLITNISENLS